jgi:hypothetical protein
VVKKGADRPTGRRSAVRPDQGDLTSFASMLGDQFALQVEWLAQLIGDAHHPTLGEYKEGLLREVIARFVPTRFAVGTGFVLFPTRELRNVAIRGSSEVVPVGSHLLSRQLDVIVYDQLDYVPVFRDTSLVVVRPEAVRAIVEVKGRLTREGIDDTLDLFRDYAEKWRDCRSFYRLTQSGLRLKPPLLAALAWSIATDRAGGGQTDGRRLRERIVARLRELPRKSLPGLPLIDAFLIYSECEVQATLYVDATDESHISFGYITDRGRFVRYDEHGVAKLAGDKTVSSLLSMIHWRLDGPFNTAFAYVDQTSDPRVMPYPDHGFTVLLSGDDEVELVSLKHFDD